MKHIAILFFVCCVASYAQYVPPAGSGGGGGGSGTVTSVAVTAPSYFSISGSPITTSGTFALTAATGQTTARFVATCNGATSIALCAPAASDLPSLPESQITGLVSDLASKGSGNVTATSLTTNRIPKASGATAIADSSITDDGTTVSSTEPIKAPSISTGSTPPASSVCTPGTAGMFCMSEGTTPTGTLLGVGNIWFDSSHLTHINNNNVDSYPLQTAATDITATHAVFATATAGMYTSRAIGAGDLPAQYKIWTCETGLGDGLNAVAAGTYLQSFCWNKTGVTVTLTGLQCYTDNAGSSTLAVTNGAGTALLTGAVTCSNPIASGTQSGTTTIAANDFIKFTFVADGTSKQTTWVIAGTY